MGARTMGPDRGEMLGGAVPGVAVPSVGRMREVERRHRRVAADLGHNGGRRDRPHGRVTSDHRRGRAGKAFRHAVAVDEDMVRSDRQGRDGARHREHRGLQYVETLDLLQRGRADGGMAARAEHLAELLALRGREDLAVGDGRDTVGRPVRDDDGCRPDLAGEASTAALVDAGHHLAGRALALVGRTDPHRRSPMRRNRRSRLRRGSRGPWSPPPPYGRCARPARPGCRP